MSTCGFFVYPAEGHVNPNVPLLAELVRRGERVVAFTTSRFQRHFAEAGVEFRDCGPILAEYPWPTSGGLSPALAARLECAEQLLPHLLEQLQAERPDYLLLENGAVWGVLAGQILKLPCVSVCVAGMALSDRMMSEDDFLRLLYARAPQEVVLQGLLGLAALRRAAKRLDVRYGTHAPGPLESLANVQPLNIVLTSRMFQSMAERFDDSYAFVGRGTDRPPSTVEFPFGRLDSRPLVFISMGTEFTQLPHFYRACFDAFATMPVQVVMAIGRRVRAEDLGAPPDNFIVADYVPQIALLERSAIFVSHGGSNSVAESCVSGVPMLLHPQAADHFVNAQRVAELEAGLLLDRPAPARVRELAEALLRDPRFAANARRIGDSLREAGGAARAADRILRFVAAGAPASDPRRTARDERHS